MKWTAFLAVTAAAVGLVSGQGTTCASGWEDFTDGTTPGPCLYFGRAKSNWYGGRSFCQALNSDLAKITGDLHQRVVEYIKDETDFDGQSFWIGGTDEVSEGSWKWVIDDTDIPLGTPHWYACNGQPNGGTAQNYLALYKPDYHFHSISNTEELYFICML